MLKWAWVEGSPWSQLQTSEFNQIPWKVKVYFNTNKISFQRPKAPGKDHWLHSPACTQPWHHRRTRKLTFFLSQSATKARKLLLLPTILSTGIKTPKGLYGLVHCLARNLSGLPGTEKTGKGFAPSVVLGEVRNTPHEHVAVELHNQIKCCAEYPVSFSSPFPLSHTHTRKTYFKWPQRSLSNPSFGCPLKRKGCFMVFPSSGARGSRSSQAWRPQVRKMARLVFPEASPLCAVWPRWKKEAQQSRAVRAARLAQTWHWPHAQLLLPVPVQVPGLDTVKYPRVRGKPQGFSSHSCYTICRVEKGLSR